MRRHWKERQIMEPNPQSNGHINERDDDPQKNVLCQIIQAVCLPDHDLLAGAPALSGVGQKG